MQGQLPGQGHMQGQLPGHGMEWHGMVRGSCRGMAWNGQGYVPGKDRYPGRSVAGAGACLPCKALSAMKGSFHQGWLSLAIYIDKPG